MALKAGTPNVQNIRSAARSNENNVMIMLICNSMHRLRTLPGSSIKLRKIFRIDSICETQKYARLCRLHHHLSIMSSSQPSMDEKAGYVTPRISASGRRDVVTAVVRNTSNNSILLVKRSENVNTYKLHWGGVSGIVEGDENIQKRAEIEVRKKCFSS